MPPFAERFAGWRASLADLERWLLPAACLLCEAPVAEREGDALVCALCRSRWRAIPNPVCDRCGQPIVPGLTCRICSDWGPGLRRVRSAVWLGDSARRAVHRLKYDGWWRVAEAMALAMRDLEPLTGQVSLIPVPLGSRRARERGYNQSERIAASLGRLIGAPVRPDLLRRTRETQTQTALTPEARAANLAGAFACTGAGGVAAVLVDDVFTTGATLVSAGAAVAAAGAASVDGITFARAIEPVG
ncbi:MAG: ComF family protein [Gemmatimonadales bacterium]|nr:ComF family protein [Gemmatimonadales bacterium]